MQVVAIPAAGGGVALGQLCIAPATILELGSDEKLNATAGRVVIGVSRGNQREHGPRGLNRGGLGGDEVSLARGADDCFAPAARLLLVNQEPIHAGGDGRIVRLPLPPQSVHAPPRSCRGSSRTPAALCQLPSPR